MMASAVRLSYLFDKLITKRSSRKERKSRTQFRHSFETPLFVETKRQPQQHGIQRGICDSKILFFFFLYAYFVIPPTNLFGNIIFRFKDILQ